MKDIHMDVADVKDIKEEVLEEVAAGAGKVYYETYTVKKGDNLTKIAKAYSTTWKKIYALNEKVIGPDPNHILPGMVLRIPNN